MDERDFLRLVLDPGRLAVLGALAAASGTAEQIAARAGQDRRSTLKTLAALTQHGLAFEDAGTYGLDHQALREIARARPGPPAPHPRIGFGMTADEQVVLGRFFQGERLAEIPARSDKRRIVLERLALEFEPGVRYPEREVNERLVRYHDDYATLRRYLVDHGLLDRQDGMYRRSGGRVE